MNLDLVATYDIGKSERRRVERLYAAEYKLGREATHYVQRHVELAGRLTIKQAADIVQRFYPSQFTCTYYPKWPKEVIEDERDYRLIKYYGFAKPIRELVKVDLKEVEVLPENVTRVAVDYSGFTVAALYQMGKERGLKVTTKMNKLALIKVVEEADGA